MCGILETQSRRLRSAEFVALKRKLRKYTEH